MWGATLAYAAQEGLLDVSIHAPRVGCDLRVPPPIPRPRGFNSRTPCGVRPSTTLKPSSNASFQFTHPVWGATFSILEEVVLRFVSIHAPRVGCDFHDRGTKARFQKFQFTHPVWGATEKGEEVRERIEVSIHAPRVGCDAYTDPSFKSTSKFQFTHPVWGATLKSRLTLI